MQFNFKHKRKNESSVKYLFRKIKQAQREANNSQEVVYIKGRIFDSYLSRIQNKVGLFPIEWAPLDEDFIFVKYKFEPKKIDKE